MITYSSIYMSSFLTNDYANLSATSKFIPYRTVLHKLYQDIIFKYVWRHHLHPLSSSLFERPAVKPLDEVEKWPTSGLAEVFKSDCQAINSPVLVGFRPFYNLN